jgi:hypothetical protein
MTGAGLILVTALSASGRDRPVDFDTEVIPILTRSGCNTGACHGAAIGRGGFKLSLLGGDPTRDYEAIVHELEELDYPSYGAVMAHLLGGEGVLPPPTSRFPVTTRPRGRATSPMPAVRSPSGATPRSPGSGSAISTPARASPG